MPRLHVIDAPTLPADLPGMGRRAERMDAVGLAPRLRQSGRALIAHGNALSGPVRRTGSHKLDSGEDIMERLDTSLFDDHTLGAAPQRVAGALPCLTSIGPGGSLCITRTPTGQDSIADTQP